MLKLVSTYCYEKTEFNQLNDDKNEEAVQYNIVQYVHEMILEKGLIENSVEYAVAYENQFHMVKHADVILVEYCEHNHETYLDGSIFKGI